MSAVLLMTQDQVAADRERWLAVRGMGVTASEVAAIAGLAPDSHDSAYAVYTAKVTGEEPDLDSAVMKRGRHLEPVVADMYADAYPRHRVVNGGLYHAEGRPWQMATFDRLVAEAGDWCPMQIKTANSHYDNEGKLIWGEPGSDHIPVWYRAQVLYEMDVWGAGRAYVPCLFMNEWQMAVYRIERDNQAERDIKLLREAAEGFLQRIAEGNPPPIDWTASTTRAIRSRHKAEPAGVHVISPALGRRYRAARRAMAKASQALGQATNEILAEAGDAKYIELPGSERVSPEDRGVKVATRVRYKRHSTDLKALAERYPRIAKRLERETDVETLYPGTWAKN